MTSWNQELQEVIAALKATASKAQDAANQATAAAER